MNTLRYRIQRAARSVLSLPMVGLVLACQAPEDARPDNLIPADKMAAILTEVHMAESQVSRIGLRSLDSSNIVYKHLEKAIYKKFGIDTASYNKSYLYYSSHPRAMEVVYKRVVKNLEAKRNVKAPTRS